MLEDEMAGLLDALGIEVNRGGVNDAGEQVTRGLTMRTPGEHGCTVYYESEDQLANWLYSYTTQEIPEHDAINRFKKILSTCSAEDLSEIQGWIKSRSVNDETRKIRDELFDVALKDAAFPGDDWIKIALDVLPACIGGPYLTLMERLEMALSEHMASPHD